jgi:hypothetical protein
LSIAITALVVGLSLVLTPDVRAQGDEPQFSTGGTCDFSEVPGVVWFGTDRHMSLERLASYMAPVYWFSPDEPLLYQAEGADIRIPEAFPFESSPDRPVVYYQFDHILVAEDLQETSIARDVQDPGQATVDFAAVAAFQMHFYAYFSSEEGLGAHEHDIEGAEFKAVVCPGGGCWRVVKSTCRVIGRRGLVAAVAEPRKRMAGSP